MSIHCEVSYFAADNQIIYTDTKQSGWLETTTNIGKEICWSMENLGLTFKIVKTAESGEEIVTIPVAEVTETKNCRLRSITPLLDHVIGAENDGGALVLPLDSGYLCQTNGKLSAEYLLPIFNERSWQPCWGNMPLYGAYHNNQAKVALCESGRFDFDLRIRTDWGTQREYRIDPIFYYRETPTDQAVTEDFVLRLATLQGDWKAMAHWYRDYNRNIRKLPTLSEKIRDNPDLEYATRALTVRCRMAVKPLPPKILMQRPNNQPLPRVYLKFADIVTIAKEFKAQGVGAAEFCLVGWGHGGHDGAFPQLFPTAIGCGGDEALRSTIKNVTDLGYPLSLHDNYYDGYTVAENFDLDDAVYITGQGPRIAGGALSGGHAFQICPQKAIEYAKRNFGEVRYKCPGIRGSYFVDVISIIPMRSCQHPLHSISRADNASYYKQILQLQQDNFQVSMSEGARDWSLPELDRAYMVFNNFTVDRDYADEQIPLFQMVYHGYLIYNNSRTAINTWPGSVEYLCNFAWGGMPLIYFHHLFNPEWGTSGGWANDLTFTTAEKLKSDTAVIKQVSDDIERVAPFMTQFIDDYIDHGNGLTETVYSNGGRVFVNRGSQERILDSGETVAGCGFYVKNA